MKDGRGTGVHRGLEKKCQLEHQKFFLTDDFLLQTEECEVLVL